MIAKRSWVCQRGIRRLRNYSAEGIATVEPTEYIPQKLPHKFRCALRAVQFASRIFHTKFAKGHCAPTASKFWGWGCLDRPKSKTSAATRSNKQTNED